MPKSKKPKRSGAKRAKNTKKNKRLKEKLKKIHLRYAEREREIDRTERITAKQLAFIINT